MECKMDIVGSRNIQDGSTPRFIEKIVEINEHKTCKNEKRKLSQQQYVSGMYRLVALSKSFQLRFNTTLQPPM